MISKKLAIAAAFVLLAGAAPALAQDTAPAPAGMADQAAPDQAATPASPGTPAGTDQMAAQPAAAAPAPAAEAPAAEAPKAAENPYGLSALWANGDLVARGTIILLAIMSIGT